MDPKILTSAVLVLGQGAFWIGILIGVALGFLFAHQAGPVR